MLYSFYIYLLNVKNNDINTIQIFKFSTHWTATVKRAQLQIASYIGQGIVYLTRNENFYRGTWILKIIARGKVDKKVAEFPFLVRYTIPCFGQGIIDPTRTETFAKEPKLAKL